MKTIPTYFKTLLIRWSHWEYWNATLVYSPVFPYLLFLMIRSRSLFFFRGANPGLENGGFIMESKWRIQSDCDHIGFPKTALVDTAMSPGKLEALLAGFTFPLIVKPDIGGKGRGVMLASDPSEVLWYHRNCPVSYLVQEKITYPNEIGVFFIKQPGQRFGTISGIVAKSFMEIRGTGTDTLETLLRANPRYFLQLKKLKKRFDPGYFEQVPPEGEIVLLSEIGNHAQGSKFEDVSEKSSPQLIAVLNEIADRLPGFYFGRLDIRFNSWEELERGEQFSIIELNGAGSEPTHMYDPRHSIFFAWREITRHWTAMAEISRHTNRDASSQVSLKEMAQLFSSHLAITRKLDHFSSSGNLRL